MMMTVATCDRHQRKARIAAAFRERAQRYQGDSATLFGITLGAYMAIGAMSPEVDATLFLDAMAAVERTMAEIEGAE